MSDYYRRFNNYMFNKPEFLKDAPQCKGYLEYGNPLDEDKVKLPNKAIARKAAFAPFGAK